MWIINIGFKLVWVQSETYGRNITYEIPGRSDTQITYKEIRIRLLKYTVVFIWNNRSTFEIVQ